DARIGAGAHASAAADDVVAEVDPVEVGADVPEPTAAEDESGAEGGLAADSLGEGGGERGGDGARLDVRGAPARLVATYDGGASEGELAAAHERARAVAQTEGDPIADVDGEPDGEGDVEAGGPIIALGQPPRPTVEAEPLGAQRVLDAVAAGAVV